MITAELRHRIEQFTLGDWIRIGLLGAAVVSWVVMLFFDPAGNKADVRSLHSWVAVGV